MEFSFSMADVAKITSLHKNTIRNYIQRGELKAKKIDEGLGKQRWMIEEEDLRLCDIPQIPALLRPGRFPERVFPGPQRDCGAQGLKTI